MAISGVSKIERVLMLFGFASMLLLAIAWLLVQTIQLCLIVAIMHPVKAFRRGSSVMSAVYGRISSTT